MREAELQAEVARWFAEAEAADTSDDEEQRDRRGDEMPSWVVDEQKRFEKIREARAALEKEAAEISATNQTVGNRGGGGGGGGPAKPKAKAQRNFTDPESRILKTNDGFIQGYNKRSVDLRRDDVVRDDDLMDP